MAFTGYDSLIAGSTDGNTFIHPFYFNHLVTTGTIWTTQVQAIFVEINSPLKALPSIFAGKSYYVPTQVKAISSAVRGVQIVKLVLMGTLDISGPTFTDGSVAPTVTEGGVSRQIPSSILAVVTTALNATPGTMTVTYQDQDGNTAEATGNHTLTASAAVGTSGFVNLNSTDWGAIDITTATRTGGTTPTGVIKFYHVTPVTEIMSVAVASYPQFGNAIAMTGLLPKISSSDTLYVMGTSTAASGIKGHIAYQAV